VTSFSGMDPELEDLMRLEAQERDEPGFLGGGQPGAEFDPELAELERLEAEERGEPGF
jgi:hypothetical protein